MKPKSEWANNTDCGNFPCTAPENVIMEFKDTKYSASGSQPFSNANFNIISNTPNVSENMNDKDNCEAHVEDWNAWFCPNAKNMAILELESHDDNSVDRAVQPVWIRNKESGFEGKLNVMMDHIWDGFYSGQQRFVRTSGLIATGQDYEITYTGTPPFHMRYKLRGARGG